jgi:kumamolisin
MDRKLGWGITAISALGLQLLGTATGGGMSRLANHVPFQQIASAQHIGRQNGEARMQIAISLGVKNPSDLEEMVSRLYDPSDPLYHQFLTPEQFTQNYAPSVSDFNQVEQYFTSRGLNVVKAHSNRLVLDLEGSTSDIENALQLEIHEYETPDGRIVHAPTSDPLIADEVTSKLSGIVGLSSFGLRRTHLRKKENLTPNVTPGNYMTPAKIKSAYGLSSVSETGAGEKIALFELDGYTASDITFYENYFGLAKPTLQNVLVDGASATPGSGADEVTLDIELAIAMAPGASAVAVYIGPNTDAGVLDTYSKIATDDTAQEVSTSWGEDEIESASSTITAENSIFQEMATQGQSIFAAAGDSGAYDDPNATSTLAVDDPGSQPYVVSVGGTTLSLTGSNGYSSETTWASAASGQTAASGGGGGISTKWTLPSWQSGLSTAANKGSTSMRMVPDVSINANPNTGYAIYFGGNWVVYGGTSCAAPLWAGLTSLVNQQRINLGLSRLGFPNPTIYQLAQSNLYASIFHDVTSGSNLYYPAETGYDLATGWGSPNGSALLGALTSAVIPPYKPETLNLTSSSNTTILASWTASPGAASYTLERSTASSTTGFSAVASGIATTSYTDGGLTPGTTYYYKVQAVNSAGSSPFSTVESDSPNSSSLQPPTNLVATVIPTVSQ